MTPTTDKPNASQKRIEQALSELLKEKDYCDIAVAELIAKASVGKTTFYRHYDRKLDVFVALHSSMFDLLLQDLTTREAWLSSAPSPSIIALLNRVQGQSGFRRSMSYKLGKDAPQALRQLKDNLASTIETRLNQLFDTQQFSIPVASLASTLAAIHLDIISQLFIETPAPSTSHKAESLQRLIKACLTAAIEK